MTPPDQSKATGVGSQREPASITGLGPHGEFAATIQQLRVPDDKAAEARRRRYRVALVLHTTGSDWSKLQIAGVRSALDAFGAEVLEVVDCQFGAPRQIAALDALIERRPDAIISIPVDNALTAEAHQRVSAAGIKLVLMDNAPVGLLPGKDYVSVVSADNFGNGEVAAEILAGHVPPGGGVGIVGFGVDFFVTNEREIAFRKAMKQRRPDLGLREADFSQPEDAADAALELVGSDPDVQGLFVVWDEPAIRVARALEQAGRRLPITTIDLGNDAAVDSVAHRRAGGTARGVRVGGTGLTAPD
jgi:ribose transport system substrate-binding protein